VDALGQLELGFISVLALFCMGMVAGAINAVAGGGTFFVFPSLILMGIPPVMASITSKIALTFASISSVSAFAHEIKYEGRKSWEYLAVGVIGSIIGSLLLLVIAPEQFKALAPWLLLFAVGVFAIGSKKMITAVDSQHISHRLSLIIQLIIGIYGGFFAAGMGLMMMALFALSGFASLHHINGVKNLVGLGINAISAIIFIASGLINWLITAILIAGALIGGYFGAHYSKRIPQNWLRYGIIAYGLVMSAYMLLG
jgi:uncharacterized membrane protein YfcA